jgi:hypothetical protein
MGGSVNLQGGGQYSMPNIQGYGQNAANMGQSAAGFGSRFGSRGGMGNYGMPPQYDGGYGDYGGQYGGVSTGGKGFQQPNYGPAPVMQPYVDQISTGGKGFQPRQTPSQSVAYAPMNIPQMQLAQPAFYYPNIGSQMANLNANYGIGGLGAMGAFGNYPMMPRQPAPMQMYPALAPPPPPPPPPTSTGGKGFKTGPVNPSRPPSRPGYGPPVGGQPQPPGYPPVGTGGKGFQPTQPTDPTQPTYPNEPEYRPPGGEDVLRPVRPDVPDYDYDSFRQRDTPPTRNPQDFEPQEPVYTQPYEPDTPVYTQPYEPDMPVYAQPYTGDEPRFSEEYDRPDYFPTNPLVEQPAYKPPPMEPPQYRAPELPVETRETSMPTYEEESVDPFMGLNQRDLID